MTFATLRKLGVRVVIAAAMTAPMSAAHCAEIAVTIDNFTFSPPQLTVKVGDNVTWTNHDDIPHTIVSAGKFRSKTLDTDDSYSFTFPAGGGSKYFCSLPPHINGAIHVA